jgi:hypothetical protein
MNYLSPGWAEALLGDILENRFFNFLPQVDILKKFVVDEILCKSFRWLCYTVGCCLTEKNWKGQKRFIVLAKKQFFFRIPKIDRYLY